MNKFLLLLQSTCIFNALIFYSQIYTVLTTESKGGFENVAFSDKVQVFKIWLCISV